MYCSSLDTYYIKHKLNMLWNKQCKTKLELNLMSAVLSACWCERPESEVGLYGQRNSALVASHIPNIIKISRGQWMLITQCFPQAENFLKVVDIKEGCGNGVVKIKSWVESSTEFTRSITIAYECSNLTDSISTSEQSSNILHLQCSLASSGSWCVYWATVCA